MAASMAVDIDRYRRSGLHPPRVWPDSEASDTSRRSFGRHRTRTLVRVESIQRCSSPWIHESELLNGDTHSPSVRPLNGDRGAITCSRRFHSSSDSPQPFGGTRALDVAPVDGSALVALASGVGEKPDGSVLARERHLPRHEPGPPRFDVAGANRRRSAAPGLKSSVRGSPSGFALMSAGMREVSPYSSVAQVAISVQGMGRPAVIADSPSAMTRRTMSASAIAAPARTVSSCSSFTVWIVPRRSVNLR